MFNKYFIYIAFLFQLGNTNNTVLFPQNRFSILGQKWVNCSNEEINIASEINEFTQIQQFPISYNNPLCLFGKNKFSSNGCMNFYYFIFNRTIDFNDLLIIRIDGSNYTITQETATDNFVLIRHKQLCYYNKLEFWMISKGQGLALQNYLIFIQESQNLSSYSQVLKQSFLNITEEYNFTQYNLQTQNQSIYNSILQYDGILSLQNIRFVGACLDFVLYNYDEQMYCEKIDIGGKIKFNCKLNISQIKNVSFMQEQQYLILSKYSLRLFSPCFPNLPQRIIKFETIQQISQYNSSLNNYIQEQEFGSQHQINLDYDYQLKESNNNQTNFSLKAKQSGCVNEFEEAQILIKSSLGEIVNCDLFQDQSDFSCLSYKDCLFTVNMSFQKNISYLFNMTAIIKRIDANNNPSIQFNLVDIVLQEGSPEQEPSYDFIFIAILIPLFFLIPLICFLCSTFVFKISLYHRWLQYIYYQEEVVQQN
ncbi:unnamed protein product [Paramecium sonneborni]|uniref:Transmembrane protein n=1 Tax=Paramecium sonneborni TaxID=65129 RepID=A0A8S1K5P9_9CILI|nr:unnamed protein product [Paramecium sonneborni]